MCGRNLRQKPVDWPSAMPKKAMNDRSLKLRQIVRAHHCTGTDAGIASVRRLGEVGRRSPAVDQFRTNLSVDRIAGKQYGDTDLRKSCFVLRHALGTRLRAIAVGVMPTNCLNTTASRRDPENPHRAAIAGIARLVSLKQRLSPVRGERGGFLRVQCVPTTLEIAAPAPAATEGRGPECFRRRCPHGRPLVYMPAPRRHLLILNRERICRLPRYDPDWGIMILRREAPRLFINPSSILAASYPILSPPARCSKAAARTNGILSRHYLRQAKQPAPAHAIRAGDIFRQFASRYIVRRKDRHRFR